MVDGATPSVERLLTESVWLTALARALLREDEHAAEDVAQEARLAALREAPEDPDHARAWLARVARNFALRTHLRRTRRERRERAAAVPEALPSTLDLVARVNAQKRVADAVVTLDEPYRSVVLLRYFDALTARDIAERQRVPIETVRTRIKRALAQLRERLDKDFGKRDAWAGLLLPWALPVEGAATGTAVVTASATVQAASVGTAAAAVATGVATMSLTAKVAIAAAVVVAATLVWRGAESSSSHAHVTDGAASNGLEKPVEVATKVAVNGEEPHAAAAARTKDDIAPAPSNDTLVARDGVQVLATIVAASDGRPVDGALMTVFFNRREGEKWIDTESVSAKSDITGRVEASLPATAQRGGRIEVVARGFAPLGHYGIDPSRAIDRRLDLGTLLLDHGTLLKGRVVRARDGRPVANAEIRIALPEIGVSELLVESARLEGTTGQDGTFVCAERIGPTPTGTQATLYALTDRGLGWTDINIVGGVEETGGVELRVEEPAALTVSVQGEAGAPLALVDVTCTPCFGPLAPSRRDETDHHLLYTTNPRMKNLFVRKSDEKGVATFDQLPTGATSRDRYSDASAFNRYDVVASAEGYDIGFADVLLSAGGSMNRAIVLHRIHTVTLVGKVVGLDGAPIPDARVEAWAAPSAIVASTDERGEYRIDHVPSTTRTAFFKVTADRRALHQELYRFEQLKKVALDDDSGVPLEAYSVDIVLERAIHIAGRVVDENGVSVAGATTWFNRVKNGVVESITFQAEPPLTDAEGRFDYEATESEWQVTAAAPLDDGSSGPTTVRRVTGGATDLVLSCRAHVSSGAKLFCEVVDAQTLTPEPVLRAYLRTADELRGLFRPAKCALGTITTGGLDVGRWRLDLELGDHRHAAKEFDVTNDHDEVRLRVEVGAMAKLAGRIELDPKLETQSGPKQPERLIRVLWRPLEAYAVDAVGQVLGDPRNACTKPDASGRFFLDGFVPGKTAIVFATDFDDLYDELVFTPTSGESRSVVLTLRPAAHWIIERVDDFSAGNLVVDLACGDEPWHREGWMDRMPRDAKNFPHAIAPGHHRWRALYLPSSGDGVAPRVQTAEGEFDVAAGETYALRITGLR